MLPLSSARNDALADIRIFPETVDAGLPYRASHARWRSRQRRLFSGSWRRQLHSFKDRLQVATEDIGDEQKFHSVKAAEAAFVTAHEGLRLPEHLRQCELREGSSSPRLGQQFAEPHVSRRGERAGRWPGFRHRPGTGGHSPTIDAIQDQITERRRDLRPESKPTRYLVDLRPSRNSSCCRVVVAHRFWL